VIHFFIDLLEFVDYIKLSKTRVEGNIEYMKQSERPASFYNGIWERGLKRGKRQFGDQEQSFQFLKMTGVLDRSGHLLEVGCGLGGLSHLIARHADYRVVAADISHTALQAGRTHFPEVCFVNSDAAALSIRSEMFDVCASFDVAEHVLQIDDYLSEIYRILKSRGIFVFQTPNGLINPIAETIRWRGFGWKVHHPSLQTAGSLKRKLLRAGFSSMTIYQTAPFSSDILDRKLPGWIAFLVRRIPWEAMPVNMLPHFWGIAYKK
jgi:ubiquinone/menaquinone biosynthesis C-methylase UbiE